MNRREMLKLGLLSGAAALLPTNTNRAVAEKFPTGGNFPPSPKTTAFIQELPRMPTKTALPGGAYDLLLPENGGVLPNGTVYPQITGNDALTTYRNSLERIVALQQRVSQFPPKLFYVLNVRQAKHVFHPEAPYKDGSIIWGYDGIYPGPTFMNRYGVPILVRIFNRLFNDKAANGFTPGIPTPGGFGNPQISTHLHNGHTGSESDGNPADIYPPTKPSPDSPPYPPSIMAIRFRDHHYGMFRAGLNPRQPANMPRPNANDGDITETVSTLWYHDHSMEHTAENVYKGLVGFHLFFDEVDSGNENDHAPALRLPSGEFDIPLLFQDKRFDDKGQLVLDPLSQNHDGFLGDKFVVNGAIQPKLTVLRRKYRFRLLNAGPSRFYQFFLIKENPDQTFNDQKFNQIGNDESLLEQPVEVTSVLLGVAERGDVIIDFSQFKKSDRLYLENRLIMQDDGTGPDGDFDPKTGEFIIKLLAAGKGDQILRFDVGDDTPDPSKLPAKLRANPPKPKWTERTPDELKILKNHKPFEFDQGSGQFSGQWVINKKGFDTSPSTLIRQNPLPGDEQDPPPLAGEEGTSRADGEVWTIKNAGGSFWSHPIHIHIEEFRILWRKNGKAAQLPPPHEQCRKDVLRISPNEEVQIYLRFRDFLGKYPIHCHNVLHEDQSMMLRFDVVGDM